MLRGLVNDLSNVEEIVEEDLLRHVFGIFAASTEGTINSFTS